MVRTPLLEDPSFSILRDVQLTDPLLPMPLVMAAQQVQLTTLVPDARHIIATESGHNIHQDQPELVIQAIREVVDAVRDPSTWTVATPVANASPTS
jgi:pimeloyl-ACP methyl ester carboxylesterase